MPSGSPPPPGYERCARCDCLVGQGNLPRNFHGQSVCDDCFTILVRQDGPLTRLDRRVGAWLARIQSLFRP